jgi:hypothetical protein
LTGRESTAVAIRVHASRLHERIPFLNLQKSAKPMAALKAQALRQSVKPSRLLTSMKDGRDRMR